MVTIMVCKNCGGKYPCWCNNKKYIRVLNWVQNFIERLSNNLNK